MKKEIVRKTESEREFEFLTFCGFLFFSRVREIGSCFSLARHYDLKCTVYRSFFFSLVGHHYLTDHQWRNRMSLLPVFPGGPAKPSPCFLYRKTTRFSEPKQRWLLLIFKYTNLRSEAPSPHLSHTTA